MLDLRFVDDPPGAGSWNMGVDELMLELAATQGQAVLRFYRWKEPTLSLGYFQSLADRATHAASSACPVVRRTTGGGAILHDQELTYSIALPISQRWATSTAAVYDWFHDSLVDTLSATGIPATRCERTLHPLEGEPFLCFERRAQGDILVRGQKIGGSAQRRNHGALLQHGSVLLARSVQAPELVGLRELGLEMSPEHFAHNWLEKIRSSGKLPGTLTPSNWLPHEIQKASLLAHEKYDSASWNAKR